MRRIPGTCLALSLAAACRAPALERFAFERAAMGTAFRVVLYAPDAAAAERAAERAFARVAALDDALSDWDPRSELSRLGDRAADGPTGPVPVSADLFRVLARAAEVSAATGGAFDVTVGPLVRLWRRSARQGALPAVERLAAARAAVGWELVALDPERRTAALARAGMRLDLGGIAKGYALDEALAALRAEGVTRALVDGGGDVATGDPPPGRDVWRIAVGVTGEELAAPAAFLELANAACATSGDLYQRAVIDGVAYSHVIDPRTGLGSTRGASATVVARRGVDADAWASALSVLGGQGLARIEERAGLEARVVERAADEPSAARARESSGWARMMVAR